MAAGAALTGPRGDALDFDTKTSSFSIRFKDEESAYRDMSALVAPGATLTVEAVDGPSGEYRLKASHGMVSAVGAQTWRWTAPSLPGVYDLHIDGPPGSHSIDLHTFVPVPATAQRGEVLNGYRIGRYPDPQGNKIYEPPTGFIEVTKDNQDTKVSPHFRLKQFLCKQEPGGQFPKYIVIKERLLLKLERILAEVNRLGIDTDTLHVMSAYRTPYYNHAIGDVAYSLHQFGSAADVFIDPHDKGVMVDLTHDGRVDVEDARYLYDLIERLLERPVNRRLQGGMGYYPATGAHPPFVHVDVRGVKARWKG